MNAFDQLDIFIYVFLNEEKKNFKNRFSRSFFFVLNF